MTGLTERIVAAFAEDATADDVRSVLADVEVARGAAEAAAESARSRALDPSTRDVPAARKIMDDAVFEHDRLAEVARRLAPRRSGRARGDDEEARRAGAGVSRAEPARRRDGAHACSSRRGGSPRIK